MKHTLVLTTLQRAAFEGVIEKCVHAQNALALVKANADEVVTEILAAHNAPPLAQGGTVTGQIVEGRLAVVYEAVEEKAPGDDVAVECISASNVTPMNRLPADVPAVAAPAPTEG